MSAAKVEEWRPVVGYESTYEVSDLGRVRTSIPWNNAPLPRMIAQDSDTNGYRMVRLWLGHGARKRAKVHRLVLAAFVGPAPAGSVTRHLNGTPSDNRASNLTYGTQSENIRDQVLHGTHPQASRTHCIHGHEFNEENTYSDPGTASRRCRRCMKDRKARYLRRKARAAA